MRGVSCLQCAVLGLDEGGRVELERVEAESLEQELDTKREKFQQHAGSDPTLGFEEFKSLYRDISGRQEDAFLNNYVESVFR